MLNELSPKKLVMGLALGFSLILGGFAFSIGDVIDWTAPKVERDFESNTYTKFQTGDVIGLGCDCLTPGATGYSPDNTFCQGMVFTDSFTYNGETHTYTSNFSSNSQDAYCGQFFTGSYWVAPNNFPSVLFSSFTGSSVSANTDLFISDENPALESNAYLEPREGKDYLNYNVAEVVLYPVAYSASASIVGSLRAAVGVNCGTLAIDKNCMSSWYPMTVLGAPLSNSNQFVRPSAYGDIKEPTPLSSFDFDIWPSESFFAGTDLAGMQEIVEQWRFHTDVFGTGSATGETFSEGGRAFRSELLSDDYSAGSAQQWGTDVVSLWSSSDPMDDDKKRAIITLLLVGKDLFSMLYDDNGIVMLKNRQYKSGAGQWLGKLGPMALYAALTNEQRYKDALARVPTDFLDNNDQGPQELQQLTQSIGLNGHLWGDTLVDLTEDPQTYVHGYWQGQQAMKCFNGTWEVPVATWNFDGCPIDLDGEVAIPAAIGGKKTIADPHGYIDGNEMYPGTLYAQNHSGVAGFVAAAAMLIPEVETVINFPGLIEYTRRYRNEGTAVMNDNCAPIDVFDYCQVADVTDPTHGLCFGEDAGDLFTDCLPTKVVSTGAKCGYYGPTALIDGSLTTATWGPEPTDPTFKSCIQNSTTWEWNGSSWSSRAATVGERNFGQTGRFSLKPNLTPVTLNFVQEIKDNWATIESIYDAANP